MEFAHQIVQIPKLDNHNEDRCQIVARTQKTQSRKQNFVFVQIAFSH